MRAPTMAAWPREELRRIRDSDDLHVAPIREDGKTYGTPTWIWSVVVGDDLYVRAYNGTRSRWYQAALKQKAGRITAAGMTKDVTFEPMQDGGTNDRIDEGTAFELDRVADAHRAIEARGTRGKLYLTP